MGADARRNPMAQWKQDAGVSELNMYDCVGRQIGAGDIVHLMGKLDTTWKVKSVTPAFHKDAPRGMVEVVLVAVMVTGVQGGQRLPGVIKLQDASEFEAPAASPPSEIVPP